MPSERAVPPAPERQGTVEIAHEALIRRWSRLQQWLDEDRKFRLWAKRIEDKQRDWEAADRPKALLLRRIEIREARTWFPARAAELLPGTRAFLEKSLAARRWRIGLAVATSSVIFGMLAVVAFPIS